MAGTSRVNREVYARFCGRGEIPPANPAAYNPNNLWIPLTNHQTECDAATNPRTGSGRARARVPEFERNPKGC